MPEHSRNRGVWLGVQNGFLSLADITEPTVGNDGKGDRVRLPTVSAASCGIAGYLGRFDAVASRRSSSSVLHAARSATMHECGYAHPLPQPSLNRLVASQVSCHLMPFLQITERADQNRVNSAHFREGSVTH
ncbi:hypothetical protein N7510_009374 [Penicillium lagena]|uniref:uncharacterized protein n=1 Tax=Penicillium lagena TaxID=94218 RepID=UPI002540FA4A|nr:uncharacterized protein N7510_009374 [Penicillium lagena]KAJ5606593.1 hypothetical protein N7510_009374 [Penicillium lagena]